MSDTAFFRGKSVVIFVLSLLSLFAVCIGLYWGHTHHEQFKNIFGISAYYVIFLLTAVWVVVLANALKTSSNSIRPFLELHRKAIILTLIAAALVFISVSKYFRVLSDETNLISVSRTMTFEKRVENITEGKWYYERLWPSNRVVDKRPLLFPFFLHVLHHILGYSANNVFILNFISLWGALFCLYLILQKYIGIIWAMVGVLFVLSQPFISLCATSGGFETFNTLFTLLSLLSLRWFIRTRSVISFHVLFLNLLMLANIRYESVLLLLIIAVLLAGCAYLKKEHVTSFLLPAVPLFLLPLLAQRVIYLTQFDSDMRGKSYLSAFDFQNMVKSAGLFIQYVFDISAMRGYAGGLNWLGIVAAVVLIVFFFLLSRKENEGDEQRNLFLLVCVSYVLLQTLTVLLYNQGGVDYHPMNGRFYLPVLILLSVLPVIALSLLLKHRYAYAFILGAGLFLFHHSVAMEDRLANNLFLIRENRFIVDFLERQADQNALTIYDRPGQIIAHNRGALSFDAANQQKSMLLEQHRNHLFSDIFVVQNISYKDLKAIKSNAIDADYRLEPVTQLQNAGSHYIRISRVIAPVEKPLKNPGQG